jgi:hypothetical protein
MQTTTTQRVLRASVDQGEVPRAWALSPFNLSLCGGAGRRERLKEEEYQTSSAPLPADGPQGPSQASERDKQGAFEGTGSFFCSLSFFLSLSLLDP